MFNSKQQSMKQLDEFFKNWEKFINVIEKKSELRTVSSESGQRCKNLNINQDKIKIVSLSEEEVKQKQEDKAELIEVALPYMKQISLNLHKKPHTVSLASKEGWVLKKIDNKKDEFERKYLSKISVGTNVSEEYMGDTGIGIAVSTREPTLVYRDEHCGKFHCSIGVPIKKRGGDIAGLIGIRLQVEDISPELIFLTLFNANSIEKELNLKQRLQNKKELIATNIHDLRNPLSIIRSLSKLGNMKTTSSEVEEHFQKIGEQVDILSNMLDNVLAVHTPEESTLMSVDKVIKQVVEEIKPLCKAKGIDLKFTNHSQVEVMLQRKLFKRAIHNLLINSINAMADGGRLVIKVRKEKDHTLIKIVDDGPGIPPEIQKNIFRPLVNGEEEGTGLGLYMVYQTITEIHQGEIWFESEEGKGTTFFIKLPLVDNFKIDDMKKNYLD